MRSGLLAISAIMGLCVAVPAFAKEIDVRIGHRDHDRGFGPRREPNGRCPPRA